MFANTPDAPLAHAGPWLVDAGPAGEPLLGALAALEQAAPAVTWLISPQMAALAVPVIEAVVARVLVALGVGAAAGAATEAARKRQEEADQAKTTPIARADGVGDVDFLPGTDRRPAGRCRLYH